MSSSRRPAKRPSGAKAVAKRATARRETVKRATGKRPAAASRAAKRPAASKSQPAPSAKPPPASSPSPPVPQARQAFRLAGSASSRLTIKPGGPMPARPLELSTKRRPSGPRRLSEVDLDEDEVLIDVFDAMLEGVKVQIMAVLERTCVYVDRSGDRRLARKIDLWVEPNKLPIRRRGLV